ncbi:MAG: class I SAM-dependent methyltransferase [Candidatus Paceibacterota bacterium]
MKDILDLEKLHLDKKGIYVSRSLYSGDIAVSKEAWERIHSYNLDDLMRHRENFDRDKLEDHLSYIKKSYSFTVDTVYLEIGCGPSHIGEYLMKNYGCKFIGIDFNYEILLTLKRYFELKGYSNYILIHSDINDMPLKDFSVDYIYGGGVIEHFPDTSHILKESYRVLEYGGVSFNTVPALTLWWFLKFYDTIPSIPFLRKIFELVHIKILKNKLLLSHSGYQLGFTKKYLINLHKYLGFKNITCGCFAIHPSKNILSNNTLRGLYFWLQRFSLTAAVYYIEGKK